MITGTNDAKLPPFPRDSKAPLDTPPAYSERAAPAPRETHTPRTPRAREAFTSAAPPVPSPSSPPSTSQGAPQQFTFTQSWPAVPPAPPAPPKSAPSSPPASHPYPYPHPHPQPADASSYEGSAASTSTSKGKGKDKCAGTKVARAVGQGMFALVAMPVVATAAALYGSGKLVEGIGRGLSAGPEAVLRACRRVDGKIKGAGGESGGGEEAREREWHRYQQQQQQYPQQYPQQQYPYEYREEYEEGEGGVGRPMEVGLKPKSTDGSLAMPTRGSLMEDPSIGMNGGTGSMRPKK